MIVSPASVYVKPYSPCINCEDSAVFVHLPWVRRHKHTFPLESISMPRITRPGSWAVNNITNIRACLDSAESVSELLGPFQTVTCSNCGKVIKVYLVWGEFNTSHISSRLSETFYSWYFQRWRLERLGIKSDKSHKYAELVLTVQRLDSLETEDTWDLRAALES